MQLQPTLVQQQKTLLNIEGLGRQLYPDLNLWETAQPFLENWIAERYSPQSMLRRLQRHAPAWLEQLPQLPDAVLDNLQHSRENEERLQQQQRLVAQLEQQAQDHKRLRKRQLLAAIACVLAAIAAFPNGWQHLASAPASSWILGGLALILIWPRSNDG